MQVCRLENFSNWFKPSTSVDEVMLKEYDPTRVILFNYFNSCKIRYLRDILLEVKEHAESFLQEGSTKINEY